MGVSSQPHDILALDVGTVRIGVARASSLVRLPEPLVTLANNNDIWPTLRELCDQHNVGTLVVGLPRGLEGQDTAQTEAIRDFVEQLGQEVKLPIVLQDEAVTSVQAEQELTQRGKPFSKGDIDALAATYILEDYLNSHHGKLIDSI
ncbi:Holliday junction resolvase RuvX [soil metagenome]